MNSLFNRRAVLVGAGGALALMGGCGSLFPSRHPDAGEAGYPGGDRVLLVGKIEIIPPIGPGEQKIRGGSFGLDPADMRGKLHQRAIIFLSATPAAERETSAHYINPRLGEWFGFWIPREHRHVSDALVVMEYQPLVTGRRQGRIATAQLLLPAPISLDLQAQDSAVYVGTWRAWRDDFHSVSRFQALNESSEARIAAKRFAGREIAVRVAIPQTARGM